MGLYQSLYVGPVIVCMRKVTMVPDDRTGCLNLVCKAYGGENSGNFCPTCGEKMGVISARKKKSAISLSGDDFEEHGLDVDTLSWTEFVDRVIVVPNQTRGNVPRDFHLESQGNDYLDVIPDMDKEVAWLEGNYLPEINVCRKVFGADNVSLTWTVLSTWR